MDYQIETDALEYALEGHKGDSCYQLSRLSAEQLDALIDALDNLAAWADEEAIKRAEKRA